MNCNTQPATGLLLVAGFHEICFYNYVGRFGALKVLMFIGIINPRVAEDFDLSNNETDPFHQTFLVSHFVCQDNHRDILLKNILSQHLKLLVVSKRFCKQQNVSDLSLLTQHCTVAVIQRPATKYVGCCDAAFFCRLQVQT